MLCPDVRLLSVTSWSSVETDEGFEMFLAYSALCCKRIQVSPKIRALPSGTLSLVRS